MQRSLPATVGSIVLLLGLTGCAKYDAVADDSANAIAPANRLAPGDVTPIIDNGSTPAAAAKVDRTTKRSAASADSPLSIAERSTSDRSPPDPAAADLPSPTRQGPSYRAIGTEPFWSVTVRDGIASLTRPDRKLIALPVTRADDVRAIRYSGEGMTMLLTPGPCSDGMSDALYADRVQIAFAEGTLKGCGGPRIETPD